MQRPEWGSNAICLQHTTIYSKVPTKDNSQFTTVSFHKKYLVIHFTILMTITHSSISAFYRLFFSIKQIMLLLQALPQCKRNVVPLCSCIIHLVIRYDHPSNQGLL